MSYHIKGLKNKNSNKISVIVYIKERFFQAENFMTDLAGMLDKKNINKVIYESKVTIFTDPDHKSLSLSPSASGSE